MSYVIKMSCLVLVLAMVVPVSAGLVLHLEFNDSSQIGLATIGDSLETVGDAAYTVDGKNGGGLLLDGSGDYLRLNDTHALPVGVPIGDSSYTVAAFFKTDVVGTEDGLVTGKNGIVGWGAPIAGSFNGTRTGYATGQGSDYNHVQNYSWGPSYDCLSTEVNYADGQWHHVAAVYDSATLTKTLYFDGSQVGSMMVASAINVAGENFRLGTIHHPYGDEDFTGTLDDVRIYDSALTATEISDLVPTSPDLIPGDANYDRKVDGSDVTILAGNWQTLVNATWDMGDFNGDGRVDGSDVTILAGNWQAGVNSTAASVPEPGTVVLLVSAIASLLIWRQVR